MKILICTLLLFITTSLQSRIRFMPMGEQIKHNELIVLVDTFKNKNSKWIKVKKILKGDKKHVNKTIHYKKQQEHSDYLERVVTTSPTIKIPWNKKNIILLCDNCLDLLGEDISWKYTEKKAVRSAIKMLKVYGIKNEKHRFQAFLKQVHKGNGYFQEQLSYEIDAMTNHNNFDLLLGFYSHTNKQNQIHLIP